MRVPVLAQLLHLALSDSDDNPGKSRKVRLVRLDAVCGPVKCHSQVLLRLVSFDFEVVRLRRRSRCRHGCGHTASSDVEKALLVGAYSVALTTDFS